jgi:hypothetical protein
VSRDRGDTLRLCLEFVSRDRGDTLRLCLEFVSRGRGDTLRLCLEFVSRGRESLKTVFRLSWRDTINTTFFII